MHGPVTVLQNRIIIPTILLGRYNGLNKLLIWRRLIWSLEIN